MTCAVSMYHKIHQTDQPFVFTQTYERETSIKVSTIEVFKDHISVSTPCLLLIGPVLSNSVV